MSKTPEYQKRATLAYQKRQKEAGLKPFKIWIKPEWREKLLKIYRDLKKEDEK